ncbi:1-(5-phosphoribosyl)-5-[(5-phosphoribosylamino)methylideneamino]imidazole-4-carboxamide isomerase [Facilibium subflavum]|uniref:1-(5-phosphoribosyl)-5-[(5- phosphoribosylamino)methylideneamino]imidazole-4- carboxamide isomerase n=1 Tax=Facilibium subflavum TaxID=2219058 RepID=UPI000E65C906|nr:1-(5-phosphoribosyl)-5-[(5-phosphoribosylamino)methylideneamino]imidazole-4-carboxamide isomerase [Facilibium subflavum]
MNIIPAIDLINGQCVRLQKGDFSKVTQYTKPPEDVAGSYQDSGAKYLHIVDLDGAKTGQFCQLETIKRICQNSTLIIQAGGGVKDENTIKSLFNNGVDRVVLGSIAVKDVARTKSILKYFGAQRIVLALDVKIDHDRPMVAIHGWLHTSNKPLYDLIDQYVPYDLQHVLCTDISRDGMLQGANTTLYQQLVAQYHAISFQASGGVGRLQDIKALKQIGVQNIIVGRALYEEKFSLSEALVC